MNTSKDHEKLFDDICNKLTELSYGSNSLSPTPTISAMNKVGVPLEDKNHPSNFEKMQSNMKKFQNEISEMHGELVNKIKTLEEVSFSPHGINDQLKQLSEQLSQERANNTRLSTDLAKSLEMCLQLQLEVQSAKAKTIQVQTEERKYSIAVLEKNKSLIKEIELVSALKEDLSIELAKAKSSFVAAEAAWKQKNENFETVCQERDNEQEELRAQIQDFSSAITDKNELIKKLHSELEQISSQFSEMELSAKQQNESLKNLMTVAENKIVEIKVTLDKKSLECQDFANHLQQSLTQVNILKQENHALKDYITKLNYYHQQRV